MPKINMSRSKREVFQMFLYKNEDLPQSDHIPRLASYCASDPVQDFLLRRQRPAARTTSPRYREVCIVRKTMKIVAAIVYMTTPADAQEAYITQVGAVTVTISVPTPVSQSIIDTQGSIANIASLPSNLHPIFQTELLPASPTSQAIARVIQRGDNHNASMRQSGLQAALIQQTGSSNTAATQQGGGNMNRASIYQTGTNAQGSITQNGSNNQAYIVQN
jgi:hypothetical protein